jgi:hypothetical protein
MNHLEDILIPQEWEVITVGEQVVPSSRMRCEMLYPPLLDYNFLAHILSNYVVPEGVDINNIFDGTPPKELQPLYAFMRLQEYRSLQPKEFQESLITIVEASNCVITNLMEQTINPCLLKFCDENNIDFWQYYYHILVKDYCNEMLPYPLRNIVSLDDEYYLRDVIKDKFNEVTKYPDREILPSKHKKINKLLSKCFESERRTIIRFSEYIESRNFLKAIDFQFPDELKEVRDDHFGCYHKLVAERKKNARSGFSGTGVYQAPYLYQCQFCYRYRFERPKNNKPTWHCTDDECKCRYEAWKKRLLNRGIELEKLYS